MIINDNTEIASLLKTPKTSVDIVAGPCFAKACQKCGHDIKEGEVYATFNYHGHTSFYPDKDDVRGLYDYAVVYTFVPKDEQPLYILSNQIKSLNDLMRYVSNTLHNFDLFSELAKDDLWGKNDNMYEALCRAFKSYWDMTTMRTNLGVKLINTIFRSSSVWLYQQYDSGFNEPVNTRTIYIDEQNETLFVEMRPDHRGEYQ